MTPLTREWPRGQGTSIATKNFWDISPTVTLACRPKLSNDDAVYGYAPAGDNTLRPLAGAEAVAATCAGLRADLEPYVLSLEVPALFVRGAESTFVTPEAFEGTKSLRPDLTASVVEGADHYVPEEQPELLAELIENFWAGVGSPPPARLNYEGRISANG